MIDYICEMFIINIITMKTIKNKYRFVAMLDIMGTKAMVKRNRGKELSELFNQIKNFEKEYAFEDWLEMTFFSDSILMYSKDDSFESYRSIVYLSAHLTIFFMKQGLGLNGCISYGKCICECADGKYITIGNPITNAYLLQSDLLAYGIAIDKSAIDKAHKCNYFIDTSFVSDISVELKVPLKSKGWTNLYMVNWMEFLNVGETNYEIQKNTSKRILEKIYKNNKNAGRGNFYIQNTEIILQQWYNYIAERRSCDNYKWGDMLSEEYLTQCP